MANPSLHDVSRLRIQPSIGPNPLLNRVQALKQEYSNRVIALADETLANIASRKPDPTAQIAAEILLRETKLPTSNRVGLLLALHEPLAEMRWVQPDPGEPPEVTLGLFDEKVAEREGQERRRRIGQWSEECYQGKLLAGFVG